MPIWPIPKPPHSNILNLGLEPIPKFLSRFFVECFWMNRWDAREWYKPLNSNIWLVSGINAIEGKKGVWWGKEGMKSEGHTFPFNFAASGCVPAYSCVIAPFDTGFAVLFYRRKWTDHNIRWEQIEARDVEDLRRWMLGYLWDGAEGLFWSRLHGHADEIKFRLLRSLIQLTGSQAYRHDPFVSVPKRKLMRKNCVSLDENEH